MRFMVFLLTAFIFLVPSYSKAQLNDKLNFNQSTNLFILSFIKLN